MSRFESTLKDAIAGESNELRQWSLRLRLAAYRARKGEFGNAKSEILAARTRFSNGASAHITSYINFAEGINEYFEKGAAAALSKLMRAKVLSIRYSPDDDLRSLVSAWLATIYRVLGQWGKMSMELVEIFSHDHFLSAETRARTSIVLADAWHEIGDYVKADSWYKAARKYALECGDDMTIGAMLYNRAAIRVFNMRIQEVQGHEIDTEGCSVAIEAASAENYSQYSRDQSMHWVFELLKGQVLMLRHDFRGALTLFDHAKTQNLEKDWPAVEFLRLADVVRSRSAIGLCSTEEVESDAIALEQRFLGRVGAGDMAVGCWSLHMAILSVGSSSLKLLSNHAKTAVEDFMAQRHQESAALEEFLSNVEHRSSFILTIR